MNDQANSDPDMTVKQLLVYLAKKARAAGHNTATLDLPPDPAIFNDCLLITISFGKEARNNMARILNTFLDMEENENV